MISFEFRLKDAVTGVDFEIHHFPSWAVLAYEPDLAAEQTPIKPTREDWQKVKDQLKKSGMESLIDIPSMMNDASDTITD
ncbi:MAG: hypothetical protein ABF274_03505 [Nonlabens sp.]|uniref:hypothetical protein n=1 Tax=Nonlabens sp. TaxID=1888209 RepID=UPI00321B7999